MDRGKSEGTRISQLTERSSGAPHATQAHVLFGSADFTPSRSPGAPEPHLPLDDETLARKSRCWLARRSRLPGEARELLAAAGNDEAREREAQVPGVGRSCLGPQAATGVALRMRRAP
eukprot:2020594-Alexandrium_andersonii.AAC.1